MSRHSRCTGEWRPADEKLVKKALADARPGAQMLPSAPTGGSVLLGQTVEQLQALVSGQFDQPKYRVSRCMMPCFMASHQ